MARILIVDDDDDIIDLVSRTLTLLGHSVSAARTGEEAIASLQAQKPALVILDIIMPEMNGIQVCRYIRTNPTLASVPILFLTQKEGIEDKIAGFEAGGDDYLTKPFHLDELGLRVKSLLRHTNHAPPQGPLTLGGISVDPNTGQALVDGKLVNLTPAEFELLYYMLSRAGTVISTEQLLQRIWGYPPGMGNSSLVRMHMFNLRRKIEKDPSHPKRLRTIARHGYVLYPTETP